MASTLSLLRPLTEPMRIAGFTRLEIPGVIIPPRTMWQRAGSLPDRAAARAVALVDITPSNRRLDDFVFLSELTLDGTPISRHAQPLPFHGSVASFVDQRVGMFDTLLMMEDFFGRLNQPDPAPANGVHFE